MSNLQKLQTELAELTAELDAIRRTRSRRGRPGSGGDGSKSQELDAQVAALEQRITEVTRAITTLKNAKQSAIADIERQLALFRDIDSAAANQLKVHLAELQAAHAVLERIYDSINNSFPITSDNMASVSSTLSAAAFKAASVGYAMAHLSPEIAAASKNLDIATVHVLSAAYGEGSKLAGILKAKMSTGDPVNTSNGNFYYEKEDILVLGKYPLSFKRFYNALGGFDGILGKDGWTHNYNTRLYQDGDSVHIVFDDGHLESYTKLEEEFYVSALEHDKVLTIPEEGRFDLTFQNNDRYRFDENGCLYQIDDVNGNKTILEYVANVLTKVSSDSGSFVFSYNQEGYLASVCDHTGREVLFEYTENQLTKVTHPNGAVFQYGYDTRGKLEKIINPMGVQALFNRYDVDGRAMTQHMGEGNTGRFDYYDDRLVTEFTEENGNKIEYHRDEKDRTVRVVYEDGSYEAFKYDDRSSLTRYRDRNGNLSFYEIDVFGNLTSARNALGETTAVEYNVYNKPLRIVQPNEGVVTLGYDDYGNLIKVTDPIGRETNIVNDDQGKVTGITLPDTSQNRVEYDQRGNVTAIIDGMGAKTQYEYDALNRVVKTINGEGAATLFDYSTNGDVSKVIDTLGNTRSYEYNLSGKVTRITDFNGGIIEYKYNKIGKIEEIKDQAGGITKLTYDRMFNVTSITNPNGDTIFYEYDQFNRIIRILDEAGNATDYRHDPNGNVTVVTLPNGAETKIVYDALNRQKQIIEPDSAVTELAYDKGGNICKITDALGNVTKREFDLANQLIALTDPLGNVTRFTYTPLGKIASVINAKGDAKTYGYYPGGQLKSVNLPCGECEIYEHDKNGNVIKVTDALGNSTTIMYDSLDRVVETINALGYSKKFTYDAIGNITSTTDENGYTTQYKYSPLSDVVEVIDPIGHSTHYRYDKMRRLVEFKQLDQITTYERNKKGEVVAVTSPLGDVVKHTYDEIGNVTSKLDEDGFETLYEYNLANRLSKISYADGKTVELSYNPLKQLTEMKDWLGITNIELDQLGRTTKVTDFEGNEVGYSWNNLHQKEKLIYPDGKEVSYEYNPSGRLDKVIDGSGITSYSYDSMGRISERILPNGISTKYNFNARGLITGLTHSNDQNILDQFKYSHDPVGNITQIEKYRVGMETDNGLFKYTYDSLNRLIEATNNTSSKQYTYDAVGNRISSLHNGLETHHQFNARNQLIKTLEGETDISYSYDKRGNLVNEIENNQSKANYAFDAANQLVSVTNQLGGINYSYDGFRNRVKKLENMTDTRYINDMTLPYNNLINMDGQNFIWGNSLLSGSGKSTVYYLQDHLGSPIRLYGDDSASATFAYDEFGAPEVEAGKTSDFNNPFGFTGYQMDDIGGLQYAQARYYNPLTGSFGAEDPIKDQLNWYGYCGGNPLNFVDPSGLQITNDGFATAPTVNPNPHTFVPSWAEMQADREAEIQANTVGPQALNQNPSSSGSISLNSVVNPNISNLVSSLPSTPAPMPPPTIFGTGQQYGIGPNLKHVGQFGFYAIPFYRGFEGPNLTIDGDGLSANGLSLQVGLIEFGKDTAIGGGVSNNTNITLFSGDITLGLGYKLGGSLAAIETTFIIPLPGTDYNLKWGVEASMGGIGKTWIVDGTSVTIGKSKFFGWGGTIGFERRECE